MDRSPNVTIESPFPAYAWPQVWRWIETFRARVMDDFGPQSLQAFVELQEAREQAGCKSWGVYQGEELGGVIVFEPWNRISGTIHCLYKKQFWGARTTDASLHAVLGELVEAGVRNIICVAFADNHAVRALHKRLGSREVGHFAGYTERGGAPVDGVIFQYVMRPEAPRDEMRPMEEAHADSSGDSCAD